MEKFISFNVIKNQYPNEWVLLGNPTFEEVDVTGGVVLYHSPDKKEVCYIGRDKTIGYEKITVVFTGETKSSRQIGIFQRV